jgi:conjugative relaxase-like TrwC/TraI family protein
MLVLHPISAEQSHYYLEGPAPGRWIGSGCGDLGLQGPVEPHALRSVLAGRHPGGDQLPARLPANRRSGFDLILAAPKSVSLLAALTVGDVREQFLRAHDQAVASTLGYLERNAVWTRRGAGHSQMATSGLVAAAFRHGLSATGDPHLHSHVVVANVVLGEDGRWSALDSRSLFRHGRAAGAVFQAGLRYHLAEQGLRFEWTVDRHGLGHIVGVPRAAVEAASIRAHQIKHSLDPAVAGRAERGAAAGLTRRQPADRDHDPPDDHPGPEKWWPRVAAAGLDEPQVFRLLGGAHARQQLLSEPPRANPNEAALERLITEGASPFHRFDVVRAAAALSVVGAPASELERLADRFVQRALPAAAGAFTTTSLKRMEERIVATAHAPPGAAGLVAGTSQLALELDPTSRQALRQLTAGGAPVDRLCGDFISQARVLEAAREAWEASGHRVAVVSESDRSLARWGVMTGLAPPPPAPSHPTVLVVDNADRLRTAELHRVVVDGAARQAKVVLLDGGTLPPRRRPESPAMETLRATLPAIDVSRGRELPGPAPPAPLVPAGRDGSVIVTHRAQAAMDALVADWHRHRSAGEAARMVALGPAEAEHLNAMARAVRLDVGELKGPPIVLGGHTFQVGDEVAALRRDRRLGSVPGGSLGRVTEVDPEATRMTVRWSGRDEPATITAPARNQALPITYSYATTPSYLRRGHQGTILGLGDVESVAPRVHPQRVYEVVAVDRERDRDRQRSHPAARLLFELSDPPERPAAPRPRNGRDLPRPRGADAARPLADLAAEHDRLARTLLPNVPPDPGPELRRLHEERQWLAASIPHRPEVQANLSALDAQQAQLVTAAGVRRDWLVGHRKELQRWDDLSHAMAWRESALGRGAEIRPTRAVTAQLGPEPQAPPERAAWRRAAQAIESHRDRWQIPDRPLQLGREAAPRDLERRADELRVLAAAGDAERSRQRHREFALTP